MERFKLIITQDGQLVNLQLCYNHPQSGWQHLFEFDIPIEDFPEMRKHMIEKLAEFELK